MNETLKFYDQATKLAKIERKGKNMPYTSTNGHMFSIISKDGRLGIRLNKKDREEFIKTHKTKLFKNYGTTMKEYVEIPQKLLKDTKNLAKLLQTAEEYVKTLKKK